MLFSRCALCLCGAVTFLTLSVLAEGRINLPQSDQSVALADTVRQKLAAGLGSAGTLAPEIENLLIESLPSEFRAGCAEMIQNWGEVATGTARWSASEFYRVRLGAWLHVVLAFRCRSTYADYAQFYDERPAVLSLGARAGRLQLISFSADCENCSDLYHLGFSQVLLVEAGELVEFTAEGSNDNPCCEGPEAWRGWQRFYVLLPDGYTAFNLETGYEHASHDDESGDTFDKCDSTLEYARDPAGLLTGIVITKRCQSNGQAQPPKTERYRWNASQRRIELVP